MHVSEAKRKGLRGFAIKRSGKAESETYWMRGTKTFASVEPHPALGEQFSSLVHPFQSFQWSDYSAKPGVTYTYTVVAMYGPPAKLELGVSVSVTVTSESTLFGVVRLPSFQAVQIAPSTSNNTLPPRWTWATASRKAVSG